MNAAKLSHAIAFAVTTLYTVAMYVTNASLPSNAAKLVSYIPSIVGWGLLAFDLWGWRLWPIHLVVGRPRLDGAWLGTLTPSSASHIPMGGNRGPIEIALVIEQTYWSIGVTLMSAESASQSTATSIRSDADSPGRRILSYAYANTPAQKHQPRSRQHFGAVRLRIAGRLPTEMNGTYWTDRLTAGDMNLVFVDRENDYASLDAVKAASKSKTNTP